MNEEVDTTEEEPPQPPKPVTVEEFDAVAFEDALTNSSKVEPHDLSSQYTKVAREAD